MELLKSPKTNYLLEASLEVLHHESIDWFSEIEFWRDEIEFYYSLFVEKTLISVPIDGKTKIDKIENELIKISADDLDDLKKEVKEHEHFLSRLLLTHRLDEQDYRAKHRQLTLRFMEFEYRLKDLKKDIFELVKSIEKNK